MDQKRSLLLERECSVDEPDLQRIPAREDQDAFAEIVAHHHEAVARLARRLLGFHDSEDAVQEVFVHAYLKRSSFGRQSSLRTWLTRITINVCRTMHRRHRLRSSLLKGLRALKSTPKETPREVQADELAVQIRAAVGRLAMKDREVVVLYYLEELKVGEIALILGISAGALNVRLHRARQKLKQILGPFVEPDA